MSVYKLGYIQLETTGVDEKFHEISLLKLRTFEYDSETFIIDKKTITDTLFVNNNKKIFQTSYQKEHICALMGISPAFFDDLQDTEDGIFVKNGEIHIKENAVQLNGIKQISIKKLDYAMLDKALNQCNILILNYASFSLSFIRRHIQLKPMALGCLIDDYLALKHNRMWKAFDKLIELEGISDKVENIFSKYEIGCNILEKNFKDIISSIKEDTSVVRIESVPKYKNYFKDLGYQWEGSNFVKKVKLHDMPKEKGYLEELKQIKVPFTYEIDKLLPSKRY